MTTNSTPAVSATETQDRAMIASAAFAVGRFDLATSVPELVRSGASAHQIVTLVWDEMCSKLDAKAGLTRIGPTYGGAA